MDPPCLEPPLIVSSDPPHCSIDARVPFVGTPTNRKGFTSIALLFSDSCGSTEDDPSDYTLYTLYGLAAVQQVIASVETHSNMAIVTFARPIPTCH